MSKTHRTTAALAAALLTIGLSACGGDNSTPEAAPEPTVTVTAEPTPTTTPTPSPTPEPTPTEEPVALVSNSTTCQVVMGSPSIPKSAMSVIVNFINNPNADARGLTRAMDNFEDIKVATESAKEPLRGQLDAYVATLQPYFDDLEATGSANLRTAAFKTAGFEIVRICTPYLT
jgi:hypothetical protein